MNNWQSKFQHIAFIILCTSALSGCEKPLQTIPADDSILTQEACQFPCWYGLTPGESGIDDIRQVVESESFIVSSQGVRESVDGVGRTVLRWWHTSPQEQSRLLIDDEILYSTEITPHLEFTMGNIIDLYGEPSAIEARLENWYGDGTVIVKLFLFYPQNGLVILFQFPQRYPVSTEKFDVDPDIPGKKFYLFRAADSIEHFISSIDEIEGLVVSMEILLVGWPGFGSVIARDPDAISSWDTPLILTVTPAS